MRRKYTTAADGSRDQTEVIIRRDLGTKQEEIVYQPAKSIRLWMSFELSPDGSRLAIVDIDESNKEEFVATLKVLTLSGGGQKEVIRLAPRANVSSLAWTPDGKRLVYTKETPNKEKKGPKPTAIWSTAIDSGQSVTLKLSQPDLHDFAIHPDGRQITFQTGSVGDTVEVSVMEGLIPKQLAANTGTRPKAIAQGATASAEREISLIEIAGTNDTFLDQELGLSFKLPTGWKINLSGRNPDSGANIIDLTPTGSLPSPKSSLGSLESPVASYALARLNYGVETLSDSLANSGIGPRPTAPAELDSWLLKHPQKTALQNIENFPDYKTRPESIVLRTIGGQRAVSWLADFTHKGQIFTEYRTRISSQEVRAMVWMRVPVARFEALRPAFETLVESVRLDAVRPPSGSPVEGARITTIAQRNRTEIPLDQISGPNNSILDRTTGIAANIPVGWEIASAIRWSLPRLTIHFRVKGDAKARAKLTFANHDSKSLPVADVGSWLRTWADNTRLDRLPDVPDYKNRPGSFVARTVDGRQALSWIRDFEENGEPWNEYATVVYTEAGVGFIYIAAPTTKVETLRPAYETLVESVRFDAVRPPSGSPVEGARIKSIAQSYRTEIPLEEISGPDNSILDRKFKLSATLPAGWTITSAARSGNGDTSIDFISPEALHANINYRATTPGHLSAFSDMEQNRAFGPAPTTPAELDAWMRKLAQESVLEGRKFRPESFVTKTIKGIKAWSWMVGMVDSTNNDRSRITYWTAIESGKSGARFRLTVPAANFDVEAMRPVFDAIIESLRMP